MTLEIQWRALTFDIDSPDDRAAFQFHEPNETLPVTHGNSPIRHGVMCALYRDGKLANENYPWVVNVSQPLSGDSIDFALLDDFCQLAATLTRQVKPVSKNKPAAKRVAKRGR